MKLQVPCKSTFHDQIDYIASNMASEMMMWHRELHAMPEIANQEYRTAAWISDHLSALGLEDVRTHVAQTGVIALLMGGRPGPVVAASAEMDADIIQGGNDFGFDESDQQSAVSVAHVLGHDFNMAVLMATAKILSILRDQLPGSVKLIFQPAHSSMTLPQGERAGAELMVAEGALDNPKPQAIFSVKSDPHIATGAIEYGVGAICASAYRLNVKVNGHGTFGAYPWLGIDPLPIAAQIILALQAIPSRQIDLTRAPTQISIGTIKGGDRFNRTAASVVLQGTIRLLDPSMEEEIFSRIKRTVCKIAEATGSTAKVEITPLVPMNYSDPHLVNSLLPSLRRSGLASELLIMRPTMGSDNFSFFSKEIPAFYFSIGTKEENSSIDSSVFFDARSLVIGARVLTSLIFDYLFFNGQHPH